MSEFKEFQGKTLDEAIQTACDHFGMGREKLEIEIITGGSTGVFGIMGVRKARLKARPRKAFKTDDLMGEDKAGRDKKPAAQKPKREPKPKSKSAPRAEEKAEQKPAEQTPAEQKPIEQKPIEQKVEDQIAEAAQAPAPEEQPEAPRREAKPKSEPKKERRPAPKKEAPARDEEQAEAEPPREAPSNSLENLDKDEIEATVREALGRMLEPIVGEAKLDITFDPDRVKVFIDDDENSGLIIGREGQTLSSLQYLVNRLVSRKMETSVRVQIDTGDYRERQDDKLRQLAQHLADKAVNQSRTQSTKPLSSYHRRVVHLTLQDNETVFTRSKGDGPLKRVLIVPKRRGGGRRNNARNER